MELDLDTFLTTVYCLVDDLYRQDFASAKPKRPGKKAELADSEVLTLALIAQWQQDRSERAFLRHACAQWRDYFPRLLSQSAFNRRLRDLSGVLCLLGPLVSRERARLEGKESAYEVLDAVPVPLMRRCRGRRHRVFADEAAIGKGGSDKEWYYGVHLLTAVNTHGEITGFIVGPADTGERWLAEALFRWRRDPEAPEPRAKELDPLPGPSHKAGRHGARVGPTGSVWPRLGAGQPSDGPYLADLGFTGGAWARHWRADWGASVLTKADYARDIPNLHRQACHWLSSLRQVVETVYAHLTDQLGLKFPRARSPWGLRSRLAAKIAAFNVAVYVNYQFGRQPFALFNPLG